MKMNDWMKRNEGMKINEGMNNNGNELMNAGKSIIKWMNEQK